MGGDAGRGAAEAASVWKSKPMHGGTDVDVPVVLVQIEQDAVLPTVALPPA